MTLRIGAEVDVPVERRFRQKKEMVSDSPKISLRRNEERNG